VYVSCVTGIKCYDDSTKHLTPPLHFCLCILLATVAIDVNHLSHFYRAVKASFLLSSSSCDNNTHSSISPAWPHSFNRASYSIHSSFWIPVSALFMHTFTLKIALLGILGGSWLAGAYSNFSRDDILQSEFSFANQRPPDCPACPSCFNCRNPSDKCHQYATCNQFNGKCDCPQGFGGDDCSEPLCGSLPDGEQRLPPEDNTCNCKEGWSGINCNVCQTNDACTPLMPLNPDDGTREKGVCYKEPLVVKENYQVCKVTNQPILDQLNGPIPEVTFSCEAKNQTCNFQCKQPIPSSIQD
jgi:hypothetical protein